MDKISQNSAEWHVDCGDMVKIETRCRNLIRRTFGRIPWHVIPQPPATLQGVIIPFAVLKVVFRHIFFLLFLVQFGLWRAANFVSSRIYYLKKEMKPTGRLDDISIVRLTEWMRDTNHEPVWVDVVHAEVLHVAGETFVEPQVVPPRHRHQIPEPLQQRVYTQFPPLVPVMFSRPTRFSCRVTAVQTV